ncbi:hypothetical protein ATANTOWER_019153 [Ataeniobius toweri]|uniref:Uncharacterized protein n=1 Tax=Ataeniobius toweri TaxID=208326 RepID=A0ABU7BHH7_9TELE|nr:hypothetical protein [Ataeniobius toweri]
MKPQTSVDIACGFHAPYNMPNYVGAFRDRVRSLVIQVSERWCMALKLSLCSFLSIGVSFVGVCIVFVSLLCACFGSHFWFTVRATEPLNKRNKESRHKAANVLGTAVKHFRLSRLH